MNADLVRIKMKAEDIIAIDTKTPQKVLNYNGPVLQETFLLEVKEKYCRKCRKKTKHEWVRNHHFHYWRCPVCLEKHLKSIGTFTPAGYFKRAALFQHLETLK